MTWPFGDLQMFGNNVILLDPPWDFSTWSVAGAGKSPSKHYQTMRPEAIKALPVGDLAARDCAMFLWAVDPMLDVAIDCMRHWGFRYVTVAFTWVKRSKKDTGWHMSTGYWTRSNPEMCLLGLTGQLYRDSCAVRQLIIEPVREHSRKPDRIHSDIDALLGGPEHGINRKCELFARRSVPGWDSWGLESTKFDLQGEHQARE